MQKTFQISFDIYSGCPDWCQFFGCVALSAISDSILMMILVLLLARFRLFIGLTF